MIIDLDSHLHENYFLDAVYKLEGPYAKFTPVKIGHGKHQEARFDHCLNAAPAQALAIFDHSYMGDPKEKWRGGEYAERKAGGWDMERRMKDNAREGVKKQIVFPTSITIPTENIGGLGLALASGLQQLGGEACAGL